ncbi:MAG: hypothetical protein ACKOXM_01345 [Agromyces sp.]
MLLRIDPRLSIVWRSVTQLQLGVPEPVAFVTVDGEWELHIVELLRVGVEEKRLRRLCARSRAPQAEARLNRVLTELTDALDDTQRRSPQLPSVALHGDPDLVAAFRITLNLLGVAVDERAGVAVLIDHFFARPERYQPILAADLAHIAVLCDDHQVRVSPLVIPGVSACLYCVELYQRDHDADWPAVVAQLLRRRAASARSMLLPAAAIEVAATLSAWSMGRPLRQSLTVLRADERAELSYPPHPNCGCCSLPGTERAIVGLEGQLLPNSRPTHVALA